MALTMQFGGLRAVDTLSMTAPPARITALIGPNGAGKTTALNMLSGYYRASAGSFALGTQVLGGRSAWRIARAGVARTYQTSQLFGSLSVEENVALAARRGRLGPLLGAAGLRADDARRRAAELLDFCGYAGRRDARAADLAHVDRRLVEIARALALDPEVMLLDEPAAGLSQADKARLAGLLQRIAEAGMTVLLVEHDMTLVMGISDQVVVLDAGQHLAAGTPAEIQGNAACARPTSASRSRPTRRLAPKRGVHPATSCWASATSSPATARSRCCTASTCRCGRARRWRCSVPTAPARRR